MAETERETLPADCAIIHEIYDNGDAQEQFEYELEQALEAGRAIIVIEPSRLGDETARWIAVGNGLHKAAVLAGVACLVAPWMLPARLASPPVAAAPLGLASLACAALYGLSWRPDPCCRYQVEQDARSLARLPLHALTTAAPVVLVRRDDRYRRALHNAIAGLATLYLATKFYHWCAH